MQHEMTLKALGYLIIVFEFPWKKGNLSAKDMSYQ